MHSIITEAGRIPVQRTTLYRPIRKFDNETQECESILDRADPKQFGSYHELIKLDKFKFKS
jgi:5-amino-6-(D-ribitylamino)uracil---L-tyrosine 4-hydroxyphenyl transferase